MLLPELEEFGRSNDGGGGGGEKAAAETETETETETAAAAATAEAEAAKAKKKSGSGTGETAALPASLPASMPVSPRSPKGEEEEEGGIKKEKKGKGKRRSSPSSSPSSSSPPSWLSASAHHLLVATAAGKPVFSLHGGGGKDGGDGDGDAGSAGLAAAGVALGDYADGLSSEENSGDLFFSSSSPAPRNSLVSLTTPSGLRVLLSRRGGLRLSVASTDGEPDAALLCYAEAAHASLLSLVTDRVHAALAAQPSFDAGGRLLGGAGGVLGAVARGWGGFGVGRGEGRGGEGEGGAGNGTQTSAAFLRRLRPLRGLPASAFTRKAPSRGHGHARAGPGRDGGRRGEGRAARW